MSRPDDDYTIATEDGVVIAQVTHRDIEDFAASQTPPTPEDWEESLAQRDFEARVIEWDEDFS